MSLVKCTICGAIFEDSLLVCPVCGQGPAFFVPVAPQPEAARQDSDRTYLILGGGAAGVAAAEAIRERDATGRVTIVTDEDVAPYNRPMLTKSFDAGDASLPVHPDAWYLEQHIEVLPGVTVDKLDAAQKTVTMAGGRALPYDMCIYALGAYNFVPPMPGADLPEVHTIRGTRDIRRIRSHLDSGKRRVVVIGGGVLGLEAAWALRERSCQVTVVEAAPRIMARQLDEETSALLTQTAEREGIRVLTGGATEAVLAGDDGHVAAVRLADGTLLDADLVVLSIGVRANTAIARAAGAAVDRGVIVDDHMRTGLSDVYACGDCAQPPCPARSYGLSRRRWGASPAPTPLEMIWLLRPARSP